MRQTNCPNCGAPIEGVKCGYCGTMFYDLADLKIGGTSYLRISDPDGRIMTMKVYTGDFRITRYSNDYYYNDNRTVMMMQQMDLDISFRVVPEPDGTLYRIVEEGTYEQISESGH